MTLHQFLRSGECETAKGCVHGAALGLCAAMAAYNIAAWLTRREKHLAINAILYSAGVLFELRQVRRHLRPDR